MAERVSGGSRRSLQRAAVRKDGWTKARRKAFLDTLAATCNVGKACEEAGMSVAGAYALRRRDAAFGDLWREALALGYERLESALLERVLEGVNAIEIDVTREVMLPDGSGGAAKRVPGSGTGKPLLDTVQAAMLLLNQHRAGVEGTRAPNRGRRRATAEETDAVLRKKLDALARAARASQGVGKP